MSSKRYPEEFKIEAVKQVTEKDYSAKLLHVWEPPPIICMLGLNVMIHSNPRQQNLVIQVQNWQS